MADYWERIANGFINFCKPGDILEYTETFRKEDSECQLCQLCGKKGIYWNHGLLNNRTNNKLYVGSECIKNIDPKLLEMAKIYGIKRTRVIKEIYLPSIIPFLTAAISTAFGIGWKVVIAAEVLSQPKYAIGSSLQNSKIYLNINDVFAWTIIAILIGYLFERLIRLIEKKSLKWKREYDAGY